MNTLVTEHINPFKNPIAFTFFEAFFPSRFHRWLKNHVELEPEKIEKALDDLYKEGEKNARSIVNDIRNNVYGQAIKDSLKDITPAKVIAVSVFAGAMTLSLGIMAGAIVGAVQTIGAIAGTATMTEAAVSAATVAAITALNSTAFMSIACVVALVDTVNSINTKIQQRSKVNRINKDLKRISTDINAKLEINKLINGLPEKEILDMIGLHYYRVYANIPGIMSILKDFKKRLASNIKPGNLLSDNLDIFKQVRAMIKEDIDKYLNENKEEVRKAMEDNLSYNLPQNINIPSKKTTIQKLYPKK